jgi:trans-2,3-dihydro-3-hydroxyanthranilate isomerase
MELTWVDVFAIGPRSGNPLAVITVAVMPPAEDMQGIAAELALSETVFAVPGATPDTPPTLRIFTPEAEIPLAGHPLVGAAWVLRRRGWIGSTGTLRTPAGDITVAADPAGGRMTRTGPVHRSDVGAGAIRDALGGGSGARVTAPVWDAGLPQVMLPVDDLAALAPDHARLRDLGTGAWAGISAYRMRTASGADAGEGEGLHAEVRHFAAPIGIAEDPVTGSAAGALGAALAAEGHRTGHDRLDLTVHQGHHMGRPGRVRVEVAIVRGVPASVRVGGAVIPFLTGRIGGGGVAR